MSAPRLLLCAPASGGGKTTVTCALLPVSYTHLTLPTIRLV